MDENLVGYLLNALDPDTQRQVESYLRTHPDAQHRLDLLRRALEPLADDDQEEPPPGLSVRTLAHVARHHSHHPQTSACDRSAAASTERTFRNLPAAPQPSRSQVLGPSRSWWRRADVLVAACLLLAFVGMGVSVLPVLWYRHDVYACQNNLRLFHQALTDYSERHEGSFPRVEAEPPRNVAGIFVPILADSGSLTGDVKVSCPANGDRQPLSLTLAQLEDLQRTDPKQFRTAVHGLAGCYAYTLGYGDPDAHRGLRGDDDGNLPILADAPDFHDGRLGPGNSLNHGGRGQNVLYIDGHARFATARSAGVDGDDIYVNQQGQVGAGRNRYDTVLGASWATPYPPEP